MFGSENGQKNTCRGNKKRTPDHGDRTALLINVGIGERAGWENETGELDGE